MAWGQVGGRKRNHHQTPPAHARGQTQGHSSSSYGPEIGGQPPPRAAGTRSARAAGQAQEARRLSRAREPVSRLCSVRGRGLSAPRAAGRRGSAPHFGDRSSRQPPRWRTQPACLPDPGEGGRACALGGTRLGAAPWEALWSGPRTHPPQGAIGVQRGKAPFSTRGRRRRQGAGTPALPRCSSRGWAGLGHGRPQGPGSRAQQRAAPGGQRAEDEPRRAGSLPAPRATRGRGARLPPSCRVSRCR